MIVHSRGEFMGEYGIPLEPRGFDGHVSISVRYVAE